MYQVLKNHAWDTTSAVNSYFNTNSTSSQSATSSSRNAISHLFDKYRDDVQNTPDGISVSGTMKYFEDVGAGLDDVASLIVSEIIQCPTMGEITREGFVNGWSELGGDTIAKQQALLRQRRATLANATPRERDIFKKVYKHTFKLGITATGQRSVDKENCIEFWKLLMTSPSFNWSTTGTKWLDLWVEFVGQNSVKGINADVWNQTFAFAEESVKDETLAWWSEEAAWPALVDEFVEWMKEKRGTGRDEEMEDMDY